MTDEPCPRCTALAREGEIRWETVMPLPSGVGAAPLARDGSGACCRDCAAADALRGVGFAAARIAVGNARQEDLRCPSKMRKHLGLVKAGLMRASEGDDALKRHHKWLDIVFGEDWDGSEG